MRSTLVRLLVVVASFAVVSAGLVAAFGAIALAIDWDIPEGTELHGPSSLYDRNGRPLMRFAAEVERRVVPLDAISPHLHAAVIATEDHRFYEHAGVDPLSVVRAIVRNVQTGGIAQGGSTLTQQYVKNVYVGDARTFTRKVREAVVALQLEKERTKDEILEGYLNRVYFGAGAYGAEAAALTYFAKPAAELTLAESALLASVLGRPSQLNPRHDPTGAKVRRDRVLDEMARYGFVPRAVAEAEKQRPLGLAAVEPALPGAPYVVEQIRQQMIAAFGDDLLYNGGLEIHATLDYEQQSALERAVIPHLPADPEFEPGVVALDPRTGDVLAAWSGRDFRTNQNDLALRRGRPSGSTFKVFTLAAALEAGKSLRSTYPAPRAVTVGGTTFRGGGCGGRCTLLEATVRSVNTVFIQAADAVGVPAFTHMARRLGVRSPLDHENKLGQALGTEDVTPLDMASAYGTIANDGVACPARLITSVTGPDGAPLPPPDPRQPTDEEKARWTADMAASGFDFSGEDLPPRCYRALAPSIARTISVALSEAVARGTGTRAQIGRPQAGKTGTTNDSRQVWFVGYTPELSMAVSFAAITRQVPLQGVAGCRRQCFGGELPAVIWRDAALALLAGVPPTPFQEPGEDERVAVSPDRRRLGPRGSGSPGRSCCVGTSGSREPTTPQPQDEDPSPEPLPTARPAPPPAGPAQEPTGPPGGGGGGGGGILPPILRPGGV